MVLCGCRVFRWKGHFFTCRPPFGSYTTIGGRIRMTIKIGHGGSDDGRINSEEAISAARTAGSSDFHREDTSPGMILLAWLLLLLLSCEEEELDTSSKSVVYSALNRGNRCDSSRSGWLFFHSCGAEY